MGKFIYRERNNGDASWDKLSYTAGPCRISVLGYEQIIVISIKNNWLYLKDDLLDTIEKAWEVDLNTIEWINDNEFKFIYNLKIIKNFLDYTIDYENK